MLVFGNIYQRDQQTFLDRSISNKFTDMNIPEFILTSNIQGGNSYTYLRQVENQ